MLEAAVTEKGAAMASEHAAALAATKAKEASPKLSKLFEAAAPETPPSPVGEGPNVGKGVGSPPCADGGGGGGGEASATPDDEPRKTFSRILTPDQEDATANLICDFYESPTKARGESFSETLSEAPSDASATAGPQALAANPPPQQKNVIVRLVWRVIGLFLRGSV